jgi:hypothetical protein
VAVTSIYGLPFLEPADPPDIPAVTQGISEGVEDELIRIDAAVATLQSPVRHGVRLRRSPQSIASATVTVIGWNTEDQDTDTYWSSGAATTITIPSGLGGIYAITYRVGISSLTTAGRCFASINVASAITGTPVIFRSLFDSSEDQTVVTITLPLLAGDSFTADVFHSQGASRDADAWICCYWVGV